MRTEDFLRAVLGDEGFYCVVGLKPKADRRLQKFYDGIDDVVSVAWSLDEEGYDAYFALATFENGESRKNDNVKQLRSFFLDLDCGLSKDYPSQPEALTALREFCKDLSLPKPTIVNSGNGIHVYWFLTEAVSRADWLPVAERLKQLCNQRGLKADAAVTADSARILRIPGTHNHKGDEPKKVSIVGAPGAPVTLGDFKKLLGESFVETAKKYVPAQKDAIMEALSGSFTSNFKSILVKTQNGQGCAQIEHCIVNRATLDEKMWRATLSVAAFCEDKAKAIHVVSKGHPNYSAESTEEKANLVKGPYKCTTFDELRPGVCPNCPHWGKIGSPIRIGHKVLEAGEEDNVVVEKFADIPTMTPQQFTIPQYPAPYFRGSGGGVFKRVTVGDEVKEVPVYHNDLYVVRRIRDPEIGESAVLRLHLPRDGVREFTMPLTAVGSKEEFRKYLASNGVAVIKMDELMAYISKWINDLQMKVAADAARLQFGWTNDDPNEKDGMSSFVVGNMEVFKDRIEVNSPSSKTIDLFSAFQPKGTFDEWKQTMEFWNRPGVEMHQYMFGVAFGAPLVPFFENINGVIFHAFSKGSGLGKTTAMLAGASVWGDPDVIMLKERDTYNSKMNRAEVYKNLPVYVDEMTNTAPKDLSDYAYQVPSGQQRNRLGAKGNTERHRGKPWKTLFASTGNTSMLERIALYKALPKAEAQRILEREAMSVEFNSKAETDEFSRGIMRCYGHAAVPFLQFVMNHKDEVWKLILSTQAKIDKAAGLTKENRFWSVHAAATITGLLLAKRLGLINWQIAPVVKWAVDAMKDAKEDINNMGGDVESLLTDYWAENYNNVLRIKSTDTARGSSGGLDHLVTPDATPRVSLIARYEYDVKKLYLLPKPLKEWCGKNQINYGGFVAGLKSGRTAAQYVPKRLGTGTHINLPPRSVWEVDCSGFLTDEIEETIAGKAAVNEKPDTV